MITRIRGLAVFTFVIGLIFIFSYTSLLSSRTMERIDNIILKNNFTNLRNKTFKICPKFIGRLGNHMFIYASSYAIALSKGMKVEIDKNSELLRIFKLTVDTVAKHSECRLEKFRVINETQASAFDRRIIDFFPTSSVRLIKFLQSYIYFDDFKTEIRKQFTFHDNIQAKSGTILKKIMVKYKVTHRSDSTLIGVHIRRGDRVGLSKLDDKIAGFRVATRDYLHRAVDWYEQRFKNIIFVVASNGMNWAKENMPKNRKVEFLVHNTPAVDLAILAMCDHTISTFGSFSWWAGWLADGNVTYFKWPATETGWFRTQYSANYMDHYYPQWIGIDG